MSKRPKGAYNDFNEKTIKLKDGSTCHFRNPKAEDAGEMLAYLRTCAEETNFLLRTVEECTETVEQEAKHLTAINESPLHMMMVATVEGKIVGNGLIVFNKRLRISHRASIGLAVIKAYWNKGIGRALLTELIEFGKRKAWNKSNWSGCGKRRAISLYRKFGFEFIGTRQKGIKLTNGTYFDEHIMILNLTGKE